MAPETARRLRELPKGDALAAAQIAGIMAAKRTSDLIPLCHPLPLTHVDVALSVEDGRSRSRRPPRRRRRPASRWRRWSPHVAALTVYDMAKAVDDGDGAGRGARSSRRRRRRCEGRRLTVSDGVDMGTREDASGDLLDELLAAEGYEVVRRVVPDERDSIAEAIEELAVEAQARADDRRHGSRPARRDARGDDDRSRAAAPGIAEAIRADSIAKTPHALLSRGVAGVRGRTLVVNLPGSTGGCRDGFAVCSRRSSTRSGCWPARRPPTARRDRRRVSEAVRLAREDRAHGLRAPVRLRGRVPRRRRRAERARPVLDHGRDGRRPLARDGAEPADRRRHRCAQPAHRDP